MNKFSLLKYKVAINIPLHNVLLCLLILHSNCKENFVEEYVNFVLQRFSEFYHFFSVLFGQYLYRVAVVENERLYAVIAFLLLNINT